MADKSLGQHWLYDIAILDQIVEAANVEPGETVLEIGPGLGTLTSRLLMSGAKVTAVEFDQRLATELPKQIGANTNAKFTDALQVVNQDILKFDLRNLPKKYKVVANIPYYLTSHLLRVLNESTNPPGRMVLLTQKEVAERVCAAPGDMSILAVTNQFYNDCSLGPVVPAKHFTPPPKVDSQVLVLRRRPKPLFDVDTKEFFHLVKLGFSSPRKIILNNLSSGLKKPKPEITSLLLSEKVDPNTRPEDLTLENWHGIYLALK